MDDETTGLITRIAHLYYDDDVPKTAIARQLGLSRFRVARLLLQGRAEGLITIEIRPGAAYLRQVSQKLARHLGLTACLVVPGGGGDALERDRIARMTANLVQPILRPQDSFGFSWGRTMLAVSHHLTHLPPSTIAQLTGTVGDDLSQSPLEILRGVSGTSMVSARPIFAPLFTGTAESAAVLRADPAIATNLAQFRDLAVAVMSIGSWNPSITQLREYLSPADTSILDSAGARAEMLGLFIDDQGRLIDSDLNARRIAATVEDLLTIPYVIAAAGGPAKAPAIHAVARSGLITTLVTDDRTALRLSEMPPVLAKTYTRHPRNRTALRT